MNCQWFRLRKKGYAPDTIRKMSAHPPVIPSVTCCARQLFLDVFVFRLKWSEHVVRIAVCHGMSVGVPWEEVTARSSAEFQFHGIRRVFHGTAFMKTWRRPGTQERLRASTTGMQIRETVTRGKVKVLTLKWNVPRGSVSRNTITNSLGNDHCRRVCLICRLGRAVLYSYDSFGVL
jgi:hypothetical protein